MPPQLAPICNRCVPQGCLRRNSIELKRTYQPEAAARITFYNYRDSPAEVNLKLMHWNKHPNSSFEEVKKVLKSSIDEVKRQIEKSSKK